MAIMLLDREERLSFLLDEETHRLYRIDLFEYTVPDNLERILRDGVVISAEKACGLALGRVKNLARLNGRALRRLNMPPRLVELLQHLFQVARRRPPSKSEPSAAGESHQKAYLRLLK